MKSNNSKWEYRRIVGLIRKRVDNSSCNTKEIISYMKDKFNHDTMPHELERALLKSERIHKIFEVEIDGAVVSVWASEWDPNFTRY